MALIQPFFTIIHKRKYEAISSFSNFGVSDAMLKASEHAPQGDCVAWGIPFKIGDLILPLDDVVVVDLESV